MIDKTYQEHSVFTLLLKYAKFYERLSYSIMGFSTPGTMAILNIDTYMYSSIKGTIESIYDILIKGRINDSYALLRKYYDLIIINIYSNLYLSDNYSIDNFIVDKINKWLQGEERLPEFRIMSDYIKSSAKLKEINRILNKDTRYKNIRDRCNDHIHYNFYENLLLNDNEIFLKTRLQILGIFSKDLEELFILHISYLFYLNDHYMRSSDYEDYIDCGMEPPKDSQYFVASFVQRIFEEEIKTKRNDLATTIKMNTNMLLE